MDLAQARTEFLAYVAVERGLSVNTLDAYTRDLEGYLLWLSGKKITLPNQVTRSDVEEYIGSLRDLGMAPASVERHTAPHFFNTKSRVDGIKICRSRRVERSRSRRWQYH